MRRIAAYSFCGLVYWSQLSDLFRKVYWFQLECKGISWQIGFLLCLFSPGIAAAISKDICMGKFRRGILFSISLAFFLAGQLIASALVSAVLCVVSFSSISILLNLGILSENEVESHVSIFGLGGGLVVLQSLMYTFSGTNPLFLNPWLFTLIPGLATAIILVTDTNHMCTEEPIKEEEASDLAAFIPSASTGLLLGSLTFTCISLLSPVSFLTRIFELPALLAAIGPLLSCTSLLLIPSIEVHTRQYPAATKLSLLALFGSSLFLLAMPTPSLTQFVAVSLLLYPSTLALWFLALPLRRRQRRLASVALAVSACVQIALLLWSAGLLAYEQLGAGFRNSWPALMAATFAVAFVGVLGSMPDRNCEQEGPAVAVDRAAVVAVCVVSIAVVLLRPFLALLWEPLLPGTGSAAVKLLTINVQQGFSRAGYANFEAVRRVILKEKPHLVMLQEVDLLHPIHASQDMVEFLASRLSVHSAYGPPPWVGSWGCAMLSVVPLRAANWTALPSPSGEQACLQYAEVELAGVRLQVMNAHFGDLDGDVMEQALFLRQAVADAVGSGPLLLAGDFNVRPLSEPYRVLSTALRDTRVTVLGNYSGGGDRDPGAGYVFSGRGLACFEWEEPQYSQEETTDGFPIVVTCNVSPV